MKGLYIEHMTLHGHPMWVICEVPPLKRALYEKCPKGGTHVLSNYASILACGSGNEVPAAVRKQFGFHIESKKE